MIYLDYNATTPLDPEVRGAMEAAAGVFGNPSSVHAEGQRARRLVEEARDEVARLIEARPEEIVLTSGGTEANALAILGATAGREGRVVVSGAEHPSVREAAARLAGAAPGAREVVTVNPGPSGALDPDRVLAAAGPGTALVSIMAANNEYGGLYPIARLSAELRRRGILFHTDAVQAAGRVRVDAGAWGVDFLSLSAHKLYGPKGAGALYVRKGVTVVPHTPGGGQERRLRAGTENTTAIAGFGVAARLAARRVDRDASAVAAASGPAGERAPRHGRRRAGDRRGGPEASQYFGNPLRGDPGRSPAHPTGSGRRRRVHRQRMLERHARSLTGVAVSGPLAR